MSDRRSDRVPPLVQLGPFENLRLSEEDAAIIDQHLEEVRASNLTSEMMAEHAEMWLEGKREWAKSVLGWVPPKADPTPDKWWEGSK